MNTVQILGLVLISIAVVGGLGALIAAYLRKPDVVVPPVTATPDNTEPTGKEDPNAPQIRKANNGGYIITHQGEFDVFNLATYKGSTPIGGGVVVGDGAGNVQFLVGRAIYKVTKDGKLSKVKEKK